MFGSLLGIATDVARITLAPVEVAVEVVRTVTKPIADTVEDAAESAIESIKDARGN